ncbi:hypothetical protein CSB37_02135 [bacterium DOLZORAL124_38_8]|nr:MAG: hypothetical protein CSB37_02135 [bacterium DOLZORAL124_38_8]
MLKFTGIHLKLNICLTHKKMKKFLAPVLGLFLALGVMSIVAPDFVAPVAEAQLITPGDNVAGTGTGDTEGSLRQIILRYVSKGLTFLGIVAVIIIIWGGFQYMTSAGEDTEKAKNTIIYAAVGILVIMAAYAIVNTVIAGFGTATGSTI